MSQQSVWWYWCCVCIKSTPNFGEDCHCWKPTSLVQRRFSEADAARQPLYGGGEKKGELFSLALCISDTVTLEINFWYSQNCYREGNIILDNLSIFHWDAISTDLNSQNIISHNMKIISSLMIMYETQYLFKYVFA